MVSTLIYLSLLSAQPVTEKPCDGRFEVTQQAYRFADLPQEIYNDLHIYSEGKLGDPDDPLLQTDAPSKEEQNYATLRLKQAWLVNETWYVSLQMSLTVGLSSNITFGFREYGNDRYEMRHGLAYKGPICEVIDASLKGVLSGGVIK